MVKRINDFRTRKEIIKNMKKINIFIGIGIGLMIIAALAILSGKVGQFFPGEEVGISQEKPEKKVTLIIDGGEGEPKTINVEFKEGMTAFDLLKTKDEELDLNLKTKSFDIGIMIETIGDKENGQDGKYWFYYVNGEMPMVAADKKEIKPGDKVEFRFEESSF